MTMETLAVNAHTLAVTFESSKLRPPTPFKVQTSKSKTNKGNTKRPEAMKNKSNKENASFNLNKKKPVAGKPDKSSFKPVKKNRPFTAQPLNTPSKKMNVQRLGSSHKLVSRRTQKTQKTSNNTSKNNKNKKTSKSNNNGMAMKSQAEIILRELSRMAALPRNQSFGRKDNVVRLLASLLRTPREGLKEKTLQNVDSIRAQLATTPLFGAASAPSNATPATPATPTTAFPEVTVPTASKVPVPTATAAKAASPKTKKEKTKRRQSRRQSKQPAEKVAEVVDEEVAPVVAPAEAPVVEVVEVVKEVVVVEVPVEPAELEEIVVEAKEVVKEVVTEEVEEVVVGEVAEEVVEEEVKEVVSEFDSMKYRDLQKACKSRGLKAGGSAVDLRKRLVAHKAE